MKKILFVGAAVLGLVWVSNVSQNAQAQREKEQTAALIQQLKQDQSVKPTPTPGRDLLHVTEAISRDDPTFIARVMQLLRPEK